MVCDERGRFEWGHVGRAPWDVVLLLRVASLMRARDCRITTPWPSAAEDEEVTRHTAVGCSVPHYLMSTAMHG